MNKAGLKECANKSLVDKKLRYILFFLFLVFIFSFLLYLNIKTPLLGDDLTYTFIFDTTQPIESFQDIVTSQTIHYHIWGGRVVVHSIAQLLLLQDTLTADIINTIAFIGLIVLVYLHINRRRSLSVSLLIGVFLLIWFLEPFAETILWITGSANYLWGTVIILAFLLPFRFYENRKKQNYIVKSLQILAMFVLGVIAGWTNENIAAGMLLMILLFVFYYKFNEWKVPSWVCAGFAGALIGYILMIVAPGNSVRAIGTETSFFLVAYRFFRHTQALLNIVGLLNLAFIILAVYIYKTDKQNRKKILYRALIYEIGVLAAVYVMIFSPAFPLRAWFGVIIFNIIALGVLIVNIDNEVIRKIKYAFLILGLLVFSFDLFDVYKDVTYVEKKVKEREQLILSAVKNNQKEIILENYQTHTKYAIADATYAAPLLSRYYGIEVKFAESSK